jgi:hypothetical protein
MSLFFSFSTPLFLMLSLFSFGWAVWKTGRSALLGWGRMERLHRLIEEERWEIQHHRAQERRELGEMYRAKGFDGKLLEEVLDVLMSDDNRLLKVMLEEELGLTLEAYEHPLRQAIGALFASSPHPAFACWACGHFPILVYLSLQPYALPLRRSLLQKLKRTGSFPFFCGISPLELWSQGRCTF